jgi:hypothetical protein
MKHRHTRAASCVVLALLAGPFVCATLAQSCDPTQAGKLLASDGAAWDFFGRSVAISGDRAIVGAPMDDDPFTDSGSAYIFLLDGGQWQQQVKLTAGSINQGANFGQSVAIAGDFALVGAPFDNRVEPSAGAVHVYKFDGIQWLEHSQIVAGDAAASDYFGWSVALSGNTAIIGASDDDDFGARSGSAYIFRYDGSDWIQTQKLLAADGTFNDKFGYAVAISGDTVIVGAYQDSDLFFSGGSAYVFRYDLVSGWIQEAKLVAPDGAEGNEFGATVGISGDTAVVGSWPHDHGGIKDIGAGYVYRYDGLGWPFQTELLASDGTINDYFGYSVAADGDTIVVGATGRNKAGQFYAGAVYPYRWDGTAWVEQAVQIASDGQSYDNLGHSVALSGDTVVSGAQNDDDNGTSSGSAFVFDLACACRPDVNSDGAVNTQDFLYFLNLWTAGDPLADWNADGAVNTQDFLAYLNDWVAGC